MENQGMRITVIGAVLLIAALVAAALLLRQLVQTAQEAERNQNCIKA